MKNKKKAFALALLLALAIGIAANDVRLRSDRPLHRTYVQSEETFGNPLMGFAPCAWYDEVSDDVSLLYVDVTWRELEPEKGRYDWASIEKENQFARWRSEGKHIVLRFVCDIPGDEAHMDIPDWLYEETGGDGDAYSTDYGKGYAPDYANQTFIRHHEQAVKAMGTRWGGDGFITYIELGSLGHWGEWHVHYSQGIRRLPREDVRLLYVTPWLEAFPNSILLMRRPFTPAKQYGMGLFNDMAGDIDSTETWLGWIRSGGDFGQTQERGALAAMPDFWQTAPSGGELTSSVDMARLVGSRLPDTVQLLRRSHTTFLGPHIVPATYKKGYNALLGSMGYRLWIRRASLTPAQNGTLLTLTWANDGVAPLYADWPVYISVEGVSDGKDGSPQGTAYRTQMELSLSTILPGRQVQASTLLPDAVYRLVKEKRARITLEICDPMTEQAAVRLCNRECRDLRMQLF